MIEVFEPGLWMFLGALSFLVGFESNAIISYLKNYGGNMIEKLKDKIKKYLESKISDRWYSKFLKFVAGGFRHWPKD